MEIIEHINNFLKEHHILVLATLENKQPHSCTVFYVTEDAKTLYFKSHNGSLHANNLKANDKIAASIYDKESSPFGDKQGIQILGTAHRVIDLKEANAAVELYTATFNSPKDKFYPVENMIPDTAESSMYKIVISKVKMLDSVQGIKPDAYIDVK